MHVSAYISLLLLLIPLAANALDRCNQYAQPVRKAHAFYFGLDYPSQLPLRVDGWRTAGGSMQKLQQCKSKERPVSQRRMQRLSRARNRRTSWRIS